MGKIGAVLRLTRIEHSIMLIFAVIAAEIVSGGLPKLSILLLSLVTAVFVSMGAFAINDYFDIEVDRMNKKARPLVTGELKPSDAIYATVVCMIIGIAASVLINIYCAAIAIAFAALSIWYSFRLKEFPIVGNAYVALSMSIPFIFGNYVVTNIANSAVMIIFAMIFLAGMAREIDGTIRDYRGDKKMRNVKTLPMVIGMRWSACAALLLYAIAIAISIYMFFRVPPFQNNTVYASMISFVDLMLLYSGIAFVIGDKGRYNFVRNISLAAMALALITILASAII